MILLIQKLVRISHEKLELISMIWEHQTTIFKVICINVFPIFIHTRNNFRHAIICSVNHLIKKNQIITLTSYFYQTAFRPNNTKEHLYKRRSSEGLTQKSTTATMLFFRQRLSSYSIFTLMILLIYERKFLLIHNVNYSDVYNWTIFFTF